MNYTVHGILQARRLEWVAVPFSRGSSQPRDGTQVSHITGRSLPAEAQVKTESTVYSQLSRDFRLPKARGHFLMQMLIFWVGQQCHLVAILWNAAAPARSCLLQKHVFPKSFGYADISLPWFNICWPFEGLIFYRISLRKKINSKCGPGTTIDSQEPFRSSARWR